MRVAPATSLTKQNNWLRQSQKASADQPKIKQNAEAMTPANSSGATIRDDGQSSPQLGQAVLHHPVSASRKMQKTVWPTRSTGQSPASNHAKAVPSNGLMKGERKIRPYAQWQRQRKTRHHRKRPVERDVDIISAIVR
jgi:hypothetical protein